VFVCWRQLCTIRVRLLNHSCWRCLNMQHYKIVSAYSTQFNCSTFASRVRVNNGLAQLFSVFEIR
jgi:hypothetical protein